MTTYSPIFGNSYTQINTNSTLRKRIAQALSHVGMRKDRELLATLLGTASGSAAAASQVRVAHSLTELGGLRAVETQTFVNRNTTAGDITDLDANFLTYNSNSNAYVTDKATGH